MLVYLAPDSLFTSQIIQLLISTTLKSFQACPVLSLTREMFWAVIFLPAHISLTSVSSLAAILCLGSAAARLAGLGSTATRRVPWATTARAARCPVPATMGPTVTASLAAASAPQASWWVGLGLGRTFTKRCKIKEGFTLIRNNICIRAAKRGSF